MSDHRLGAPASRRHLFFFLLFREREREMSEVTEGTRSGETATAGSPEARQHPSGLALERCGRPTTREKLHAFSKNNLTGFERRNVRVRP